MRLRVAQSLLLDRSVVVEEQLLVLKVSNAPSTFNKCYQKCDLLEKRYRNCHVLADSHWEMRLKAVEQMLHTGLRVAQSLLLDRSVVEEEQILVLKFSNAPSTFIKCYQKHDLLEKRDRNCSDSHWEMHLKAVEQTLHTAKRV
jgi:antirestriction protein